LDTIYGPLRGHPLIKIIFLLTFKKNFSPDPQENYKLFIEILIQQKITFNINQTLSSLSPSSTKFLK